MSSNAQTALIPRQRDSFGGGPRRAADAWDRQGDGDHEQHSLATRRRALGTVAWVLPSLLTGALGFLRATWPSQRMEELDHWSFAQLSWSQALHLADRMDTATVPYHLALKGYAELLGTSDFALRLPSVLAMAAAAALTARVGTSLATPRVGFIAGLLFALLPTTSRYAQEIGPQALVVCLATLSTLGLVAVLNRPRVMRIFGYTLTVALLGLASPTALSLVVAHGMAVLVMRPRAFLGWLAGVVVALLPVGAAAYRFGQPSLDTGRSAPVPLSELINLPSNLFGVPLVAGIVIGFGLLSFSLRRPGVIYTNWIVVSGLVLYGVAFFTPIWSTEALLFTVPAWALLSATALNRAPVFRGVVVAAVATLLVLPEQGDIRQRDGHGLAASEAAVVLAENVKPGDVIVYGPTQQDGQIGRDLLARYVRADGRPKDALALRPPRTDGNLYADECTDVVRCLGAAPRVWLFRASQTGAPLEGMPATKDGPLRTGYVIERSWQPAGLTLTLLTRTPASAQR
jgi:mannosyltransferase